MITKLLLITFVLAFSKPHRTVVSVPHNRPLQADTAAFTGTICANCEEETTCTANSTRITSATVTLDGTEVPDATISDDGTFTLNLQTGQHTIVVRATCPFENGTDSTETAESTQTVTADAPNALSAEFVLTCTSLCETPGVPVTVQVCTGCDEDTGCSENSSEILAGKRVALVPVEGSTEAQTSELDEEGNVTFDSITPGEYYVHVYEDPYGNSTIEVAGTITVEESDEEPAETQYFGPLLIANSSLCQDPTYITGKVCADCSSDIINNDNYNNTEGNCSQPLSNATVRLTVTDEQGTTATVEATTDDQGLFTLPPANLTGQYTLEVFTDVCSGDNSTSFASTTGSINETAEEPRLEVNLTGFCTRLCTGNITGRIYSAENDTANYTEGITQPFEGITIELISGTPALFARSSRVAEGEVLASVVSDEDGRFSFVNVPFGEYTLRALEVPTVGGPTGEGCELRYDDISIPVDVEENNTVNVSIVRPEECNNATLCGQILFAANYCTAASGEEDEEETEPITPPFATFDADGTQQVTVTVDLSQCECSITNTTTTNTTRPPRPGPRPPYPPPPPPHYNSNLTDTQRLWIEFLLGINRPTFADTENVQDNETDTSYPSSSIPVQNSKQKKIKNQRMCPPRHPPHCPPHCPPPPPPPPFYPPYPPVPPITPDDNTTEGGICNCTVSGSFEGCFSVVSPLPTATARLYRRGNATTTDPDAEEPAETEEQFFTLAAETEVYPNGSFCFTGLAEGDNYYLEIAVSENDTLDLERSNISEALGGITSTVVAQEGAYPPTQQLITFGPITLTGNTDEAPEPFTAVFTNEEAAREANVSIVNGTFITIPPNSSNSTNSTNDNSTAVIVPTRVRYVDPFGGESYMYPLASHPKKSSSSSQIVTPSSVQPAKKSNKKVIRKQPEESSSITVIRPQSAKPAKKETPKSTKKSASPVRTPASKQTQQKKSVDKTKKQTVQKTKQGTRTTHSKTVKTRQGSTSTTTVTKIN